MAPKRGLNMAKGLESLIPQGKTVQKEADREDIKSPEKEPKTQKKQAEHLKEPTSAGNRQTSAQRQASKKESSSSGRTGSEDLKDHQPLEVRIAQVVPNQRQPRTEFDKEALNELADSIRQYGVIQPLLVQKSGKYYEIIAGERRWRAAKLAGLKKVPVIVREYSHQEVVEISLIENIQREDLNAIEEARAYKRLLEEFDLKQEEVAKRVSKSRSAVTNSMRLLNLDERIQGLLIADQISAGHARTLLALESPDLQYTAAQEILTKKLSVRDTERLVKRLLKPVARIEQEPRDTQLDAAYHTMEEQLTERMGTRVSIHRGRGSKGKIEIEYYSQDDLNRIIDLLQ